MPAALAGALASSDERLQGRGRPMPSKSNEAAKLERAPAYPAFWFGWLSYFPWTEVWKRPFQ